MKNISVDEFEQTISQEGYVYVLFSSEDCGPCEMMKDTIREVSPVFNEISFYFFYKDQEGADEIRRTHLIGYPPRSVIYKDGSEVGRLYGYMNAGQLSDKLIELRMTSEILTSPEDSEELTRFYNRVMKEMDIDWSQFENEKRQEKCEYITDIADKIVENQPAWAKIDSDSLRSLLTN